MNHLNFIGSILTEELICISSMANLLQIHYLRIVHEFRILGADLLIIYSQAKYFRIIPEYWFVCLFGA